MDDILKANKIVVSKQMDNTVYTFENENQFVLLEYKALKNQKDNNFVDCAKVSYNGKTKLIYFTSKYRQLVKVTKLFDSEVFLAVMASLVNTIIEVKNNGFLHLQNLDLKYENVFFNQSDLTVKLIYLPIDTTSKDIEEITSNLKKEILKLIEAGMKSKSTKIDLFCNSLKSPSVSIEDLYKLLIALNDEVSGEIKEAPKKAKEENSNQPALVFKSKNAGNPLEFVVKKSEFFIGKKAGAVDGVVAFSPTISRIHCKILFQNAKYYLVDLNSSNGTFLNNNRLVAQKMVELKDGDQVRLATNDFVIRIQEGNDNG